MRCRRVDGDGNCLFRAASVALSGNFDMSPTQEDESAQQLRIDAVQFMCLNKATFENFIDGDFEEYLDAMKENHEWGGEVEVITLARHFGVKIVMVSCETLRSSDYAPDEGSDRTIYLLYTGQHYDPVVSAPENASALSDSARAAVEQHSVARVCYSRLLLLSFR